MELNQAVLVVNTLASYGKTGCGIISLANETKIPQQELRTFLESHHEYFCKLDNKSKFTLNPFGKYKGRPEAIISELTKQSQQSKLLTLFSIGVLIFVFGYLVGKS